MSRYCILSLDLNKQVTSEQRNTFYAKLQELQWMKMDATTTLWYAPWKDDVTDEGVVATTKSDVAKAAEAAKVTSYDATVAVCAKPVSWSKKA